jgi:hypothetical protein
LGVIDPGEGEGVRTPGRDHRFPLGGEGGEVGAGHGDRLKAVAGPRENLRLQMAHLLLPRGLVQRCAVRHHQHQVDVAGGSGVPSCDRAEQCGGHHPGTEIRAGRGHPAQQLLAGADGGEHGRGQQMLAVQQVAVSVVGRLRDHEPVLAQAVQRDRDAAPGTTGGEPVDLRLAERALGAGQHGECRRLHAGDERLHRAAQVHDVSPPNPA